MPSLTKNDFFSNVFWMDLEPHQDSATNGAEAVAGARNVVVWHNEHMPNDNVVNADDATAFLAWIDANTPYLVATINANRFGKEVPKAEIVEIDGMWHAVVDGVSVLDAPTLLKLVRIITNPSA